MASAGNNNNNESKQNDNNNNNSSTTKPEKKKKKQKFEILKWNAVALWAWDIEVDNCAICRNHIMDLCIDKITYYILQ